MIIVIIGPTGIGKTKLSLALAKHYNTEIISGDSVQVYKGLNIGSAKIKESEMDGIKHHLIDILEPTEDFSVALFQRIVREKIKDFEDREINPLIVGGTGLYIKSVLYDYNFSNSSRDKSLDEFYKELSNEELHNILKEKDYESSLNIHMNNRKRVLQAISRSKDNKVSDNKNKDIALYDFKIIGLTLNREELYEIINNRVDLMIEEGLIKEVKDLYDKGIKSNSVSAIGYKELYTHFDGEYTLEEAIDKIKQHSRNLAKKQLTFFNNQFDVNWINVDLDNFGNTIKKALNILDK
ncbi:MAG: tRNA dimethylallyltransferase [Candidatus Izimaplasma bacterium HR2]|nr:MAG: tRNA dimethylallyltransferase [Candidatus Izimaplasma bacterium HR2]